MSASRSLEITDELLGGPSREKESHSRRSPSFGAHVSKVNNRSERV